MAYRRWGYSAENERGSYWKTIDDAPKNIVLRQISVGSVGIWAIDSHGQFLVRREVCGAFPEGSHWQILPNDPPHDGRKNGFKSVSVTNNDVWSVSSSSILCKRSGITTRNPAGTGWQIGIAVRLNQLIFKNVISKIVSLIHRRILTAFLKYSHITKRIFKAC